MNTQRGRLFPSVVAIVAWSGVVLQLYLSLQLALANGRTLIEGLIIFFGYFTVLTNILVALVLTVPLVSGDSPAARFMSRPGVVAATAVSIALVGIGYHLLLRQIWDPQGWQLVADVILHYVTPASFVFYWAVAVPKRDLRLRHVPGWAVYPITYVVYTLIRGELTGLYPYPFLDLPALGATRVLVNAMALLLGFYVIALVLLAFARLPDRLGRPTGSA